MRYKYKRFLNDLKDLKHIEWFWEHRNEYEFTSTESNVILKNLGQKIGKKNIYYAEIVRDYEKLVGLFENDPYNYVYDTSGKKENKPIQSDRYHNYFIEIQDKAGDSYPVPYQYVVENSIEHDLRKSALSFQSIMRTHRANASNNLNAILQKYYEYWTNSGVESAIKRFESVGYGKNYQIPKMMALYVLYNIILFTILSELQFVRAILDVGSLFSMSDLYAEHYFSGHLLLGIVAMVCTGYFIYLDVIYTYGIYYLVYIKDKYKQVLKYHTKTAVHYEETLRDYKECQKGISGDFLDKRKNREKHYIRLLEMSQRRYDFTAVCKEKKDGKIQKIRRVESILVPKELFYKKTLGKSVVWITVFLIMVQAICNQVFILFI